MSPANPSRTSDAETSTAALGAAVRAAARFDHRLVSIDAGLLAAIPVATMLGVGIAVGKPAWGATAGAGAMLVGLAWRVTGGRPPRTVMAIDALVMALSTFVGGITGSVLWLHVLVLCLWSLMAGLLVGVGNRGGVVGTQAIIAAVVFGRFADSVSATLGLAALVLTGGLAQVVLLSVIRWPLPLRGQRAATAAAYGALAGLAAAPDEASTLPAAAALDEAAASLSSPTLLGDSAVLTLRSLVSEGQRLRVALVALHALRRQQRSLSDTRAEATVDRALRLTATALEHTVRAVGGDVTAADPLQEAAGELTAVADEAADRQAAQLPSGGGLATADPAEGAVEVQITRRVAALAGQLRAIASLAPAGGQGGGLRSRRPHGRTSQPAQRARDYVDQLRANMSLQSPAGRHALRLAVVVPLAVLLARQLPISRGYWLVVSAATVLRPEFGATFTRGTERALGTCLGVALAGAIAVGLHPAGGVTVVLVGLLAWAGYAVFPASFAVGFGFITAVVVFLLNAVSPDTLATATARLVDTLIGGTLGLLVYAVWPTWASGSAWQSLADLVAAERAYVSGVLSAMASGRRADEQVMRGLARRTRLARTGAEATVARSLSEPAARRIEPESSQGALGAMRRLVQAAHVLRLDAQDSRERAPLPELTPLQEGFDEQLEAIESTLRAQPEAGAGDGDGDAHLPDLRARYDAFARGTRGNPDAMAMLAQLDEMVDACNGLAVLSGLDAVDADTELPPPAAPAPTRWATAIRLLAQWLPRRS